MHPPENLRGIIAMLVAVALFSVMDAQLKLLAAHYGPMQVSFLRGATALPFVLLPIVLRGRLARLRPVNIRLHLLRGTLSVLMLASFVYAVRESSLATTYSIFMCAPLLVAALAVPVLGERVARVQWMAIAVGLAGVLLMLAPRGGQWASLGALAAVIAAVTYSVAVVSLRMLARPAIPDGAAGRNAARAAAVRHREHHTGPQNIGVRPDGRRVQVVDLLPRRAILLRDLGQPVARLHDVRRPDHVALRRSRQRRREQADDQHKTNE